MYNRCQEPIVLVDGHAKGINPQPCNRAIQSSAADAVVLTGDKRNVFIFNQRWL